MHVDRNTVHYVVSKLTLAAANPTLSKVDYDLIHQKSLLLKKVLDSPGTNLVGGGESQDTFVLEILHDIIDITKP